MAETRLSKGKGGKHNFPNACVINEDITSISSDDILSKLNMSADDIDVIIGGHPHVVEPVKVYTSKRHSCQNN